MPIAPDLAHERVAAARAQIADACRRAGRSPDDVELLAAVKYLDRADLPALAAAGVRLVGENRTDQLAAKQRGFEATFIWDFIGHLQSRKVRDVVGRVRLIHAVESESTARQVHERSATTQDILIEVNTAADPSKYGVAPAALPAFLDQLATLDRVSVRGLMTMPAFAQDPEASRPAFATLRELAVAAATRFAPRHTFTVLSMGTSQDYPVAVEEGATIVRLGSVLYRPAG
jgi:PLP dependent protein